MRKKGVAQVTVSAFTFGPVVGAEESNRPIDVNSTVAELATLERRLGIA